MYAEWLPSKANTPTPPHGVATSPPKALGAHQEPLRVPARYKLERPAQNWFDEAHETGRDLSWPG